MESRPPEMLEALFEHAFQLMGVLDAEGRVLVVNRSALALIGKREEEVAGQPFWETPWWSHDPKAQAEVKEAIAKASTGASSAWKRPILAWMGQ